MFFNVFGVQRPPKTASRGPSRLPKGSSRAPKPLEKHFQKLAHFWDRFLQILGPILGPKTNQKPTQKWDPFLVPSGPPFGPLPRCPQVAPFQGLGGFLLSLAPLNDH